MNNPPKPLILRYTPSGMPDMDDLAEQVTQALPIAERIRMEQLRREAAELKQGAQ